MAHNTNRTDLIISLQNKIHECMNDHVSDFPLCIVDFPDIKNCGDSAIWLGEMAYLNNYHNRRPDYVSRMRDFDIAKLNRVSSEGPVFIHGGGNFGDIWPAHQKFRERMLSILKGRKVIQFPQSIHFGSTAGIESCKRAIGKHGNFILFVRDMESLEFARSNFECESYLCPDMAFCIGEVDGDSPVLPVLAMLREDKEKLSSGNSKVYAKLPVEDWITESRLSVNLSKSLGVASSIGSGNLSEMKFRMLDFAARNRFQRGIAQISRGRVIITDRLHVHICSLLLGRPHAVLDNSYGKISRFMSAFSGGTDLTYIAKNADDALDWANAKTNLK